MATLIVTVVLAFVGYLATYLNSLRLSQRQARLERVNKQLSEFYGPLFALVEVNTRIYRAYYEKHVRSDGRHFTLHDTPPTEEELAEWRTWTTTVFIPSIRAMREVVVTKADLLIEEEVPQVLLDLCAHASGYEITAARWERGDRTEYLAVIRYPGDELREYVRDRFTWLKSEQARLLGHSATGRRRGVIGRR
ncbi:hypothetical protein V1L54_15540 [Streptomyces sp. TRM 70361]|uniref:hypothetical protein n=1 Tax=Streptomyces sp. TRM 70361 TaxID=3116553 RepID=UPI002E7C45CF|nr:hypothetical protein [Streptomyces sp. TRM 70361]MEE1940799.1 hypothetical protein [Streptomyces sp. TRM 70361]